jgi:hypothetical protein
MIVEQTALSGVNLNCVRAYEGDIHRPWGEGFALFLFVWRLEDVFERHRTRRNLKVLMFFGGHLTSYVSN